MVMSPPKCSSVDPPKSLWFRLVYQKILADHFLAFEDAPPPKNMMMKALRMIILDMDKLKIFIP